MNMQSDASVLRLAVAIVCATAPVTLTAQPEGYGTNQNTVGGPNELEGFLMSEFLDRAVHVPPEGQSVQLAILGRVEPGSDWPRVGSIHEVVGSPNGRTHYVVVDIGPLVGIEERLVSISMDSLVFILNPAAPGGYTLVYAEDPTLLAGSAEEFWDEDLPLSGPPQSMDEAEPLEEDQFIEIVPAD